VALPNTLLVQQGPNAFTEGLPVDPLYATAPPDSHVAHNLDSIRALDAWRVTTGSTDVLAAVVDGGFDLLHEDVLPNIWINQAEIPSSIYAELVDADGDGYITFSDLNDPANDGICPKDNSPPEELCDPLDLVDGSGTVGYGFQDGTDAENRPGLTNLFVDDLFGWDFEEGDNLPQPDNADDFHGTAMFGLMAGVGNNDVASPGVAWVARVMLLKGTIVRNPPGTSWSSSVPARVKRDSVIRGLEYAHENGAKIISLSQAGPVVREDAPTDCEDGILGVPIDKFDRGIRDLATEWENRFTSLMNDAILVVSPPNCYREPIDEEGHWAYPVFTTPRADIGFDFVHETMITVASVQSVIDLTGEILPNTSISSFSSRGGDSILIGAPGNFWRLLAVQPYPPSGLTDAITDCPNGGGAFYEHCQGNSISAPLVAGAGILVAANNPDLSVAEIRARILDNAAVAEFISSEDIQGSRVLDVAAAVGP
jgi:hypothetical protein